MIIKDTHVPENITMDNHRTVIATVTGDSVTGTGTGRGPGSGSASASGLSVRREYVFSLTTLCLLAAFFVCTLLAVGFMIYNFKVCDLTLPTTDPDEKVICTAVRLKHPPGWSNRTGEMKSKYEQDVRLPRAVVPLKYNISILPFLQSGNFSFEGEVQINVSIAEDCYNITMHTTELNISKSEVVVRRIDTNSNLRIRKQYLLDVRQFFVIELYDKLLQDKEYEISIKFSGLIQNYLQGFYRSSYQLGNETKWLASTQFQATDARRAFPCFDEPALKAAFTLHIGRPKNMLAISNMPILDTKQHEYLPDYVWDNFAESVPMSTYLVAYAIFDFSHLSDGNFSVWARKSAIQSAEYALSVGPRILRYLEEFFDVKFPLPKIDMVAIPDFQAGAMENWGLITYRETTMLFEEGVSATTNKQRIASVIGHELAHQWFGNLVTPSWWSDIWLNEGFASYMEYLTVDAVEPEWRTMDQFVVNELQSVFKLDALSTSHNISVEVFNPDEISEIFDRISYAKGSTIIRMMNHFLTSKVFRRGLSKYLTQMAYKSATQDDLWHVLTLEAKATGLLDNTTTVKEIMDTWTLQPGYPTLKVSRHPNTNVIRFEQERFVFVNNSASLTGKQSLWWIPITYTTSFEKDFENTRPLTWIPRTKNYEIESRNLSTADWFIFNIKQTGYYRVNYELGNWNAITSHLMHPVLYKEIGPSNRAQLIDDAMSLARGGYIGYDVALNLTRYLAHEEDHVPWKAAITSFHFLDTMFVNQGDYDLLKNYLLKLLKSVYYNVGFEDDSKKKEDMLKLFKRAEILQMACHLGHPDCIAESSRLFQNWVQLPNPDAYNPISPNLRGIVYCSAIQYGTESEWDFAFERYLKSTVSAEKELLLSALGCSKEPWILFRYLRRTLKGDDIRKQDLFRVFGAVSSNVVGQQIAFNFIRNNWEEIKTYLGSSMSNLYTLLKFPTKGMNSKFALAELELFVKNDLKESGRSVGQIIEQVQVNVDWMKRNYKSIVDWLKYDIKAGSEV